MMKSFLKPALKNNRIFHFLLVSLAVLVGIFVAFFNLGEQLPLVGLLLLSIMGIIVAFIYQTWVLALLLIIVIPTSDAQLVQTSLLVPGTNFAISYVDPFLLLIFGFWGLELLTGHRHIYRNPLNLPLLLFLLTIVFATFLGIATDRKSVV